MNGFNTLRFFTSNMFNATKYQKTVMTNWHILKNDQN